MFQSAIILQSMLTVGNPLPISTTRAPSVFRPKIRNELSERSLCPWEYTIKTYGGVHFPEAKLVNNTSTSCQSPSSPRNVCAPIKYVIKFEADGQSNISITVGFTCRTPWTVSSVFRLSIVDNASHCVRLYDTLRIQYIYIYIYIYITYILLTAVMRKHILMTYIFTCVYKRTHARTHARTRTL